VWCGRHLVLAFCLCRCSMCSSRCRPVPISVCRTCFPWFACRPQISLSFSLCFNWACSDAFRGSLAVPRSVSQFQSLLQLGMQRMDLPVSGRRASLRVREPARFLLMRDFWLGWSGRFSIFGPSRSSSDFCFLG
jgi:hypothetical protein